MKKPAPVGFPKVRTMNNDRTLTLDEISQWMLAVEERAEKAE